MSPFALFLGVVLTLIIHDLQFVSDSLTFAYFHVESSNMKPVVRVEGIVVVYLFSLSKKDFLL